MKKLLKKLVNNPKRTILVLTVSIVALAVLHAVHVMGREQKLSNEANGVKTIRESEESQEVTQKSQQTQESEETAASVQEEEQGFSGDGVNDENEVWIWGYSIYTGYLDACTQWTDYERFVNLDLDKDGLTDRVWRASHGEETWSSADYRIDFGNGDVAELKDMGGGVPHVRAVDVDGDNQMEVLFQLSYEFSTDPRAYGDMALLMKEETGGYVSVVRPDGMQPQNAEKDTYIVTPYSWGFPLRCEQAGERALRFIYEEDEAELDAIKHFTEEEWEMNNYLFLTAEEENPWYSVVYQTDVVRTAESEKDILKLHYTFLGKWSLDEVVLTLEYEDDRMRVKKAQYLEYYEEWQPVTIAGEEYELQVSGHWFQDEEICTIDWINLFEAESKKFVCFIDMEELSRACGQTGEGEKPYAVQSSAKNGDVCVQDINADGYEDLCFAGQIGANERMLCHYMFWNPEKREFEYGGAKE